MDLWDFMSRRRPTWKFSKYVYVSSTLVEPHLCIYTLVEPHLKPVLQLFCVWRITMDALLRTKLKFSGVWALSITWLAFMYCLVYARPITLYDCLLVWTITIVSRCPFNISIEMSSSHHKPNISQSEFDLLVVLATFEVIFDYSFSLILHI